MTQPTERRFVMEPRLDAEVETLNTAIEAEETARIAGDALKVAKAGDTMTGALTLNADPTNNLHAATKQYVDNVTINTDNLGDIDYIQFDTTYAGGSTAAGMLAWDQENETLEFMLDDDVTLQIGQEHLIRVKNNSGSVAIPDRTVVMFAGAAGDTVKVSPAVSDGSVNVNYLAGITTQEIPAGGFGFITQLGFINHVNTNAWPIGTLLYVDPTTPGGLTSTEPEAPAWIMPVAAVTKQNVAAGRMLVRAIPGGSGAGGGASVNVADTAPVGGNPGDMWFDSTDGTLYVYYEDADGSQWVQVQANSALTAGIESRVGALESQAIAFGALSPNYVINGAMDIWQRGTSFTTANGVSYFAADRWHIFSNPGRTWTRQSSGLTGFNYCFRAQRDSGNTDTYTMRILQNVETVNTIPLQGKTVTLSFYARKGATYSGVLYPYVATGTGTDENYLSGYTGGSFPIGGSSVTLTTSWQRFTVTGVIPSNASEMSIFIDGTVSGTAGASDYFEVTGIQLEVGSTATSFRRNANSIQGELAACQRYYIARNATVENGAANGSATAGYIIATYFFPGEMRAAPTITVYDGAGTINKVTRDNIGVGSTNGNTPTIDSIGTRHCRVLSTSGSGATALFYSLEASAEL